jgi:hypothetical protein
MRTRAMRHVIVLGLLASLALAGCGSRSPATGAGSGGRAASWSAVLSADQQRAAEEFGAPSLFGVTFGRDILGQTKDPSGKACRLEWWDYPELLTRFVLEDGAFVRSEAIDDAADASTNEVYYAAVTPARAKARRPALVARCGPSLFASWRRGGDSNPRDGVTAKRFSRPPHSTTLPPLREVASRGRRAASGSVRHPPARVRASGHARAARDGRRASPSRAEGPSGTPGGPSHAFLAESQGFEPWVRFNTAHTISSRAPSATRSTLRDAPRVSYRARRSASRQYSRRPPRCAMPRPRYASSRTR